MSEATFDPGAYLRVMRNLRREYPMDAKVVSGYVKTLVEALQAAEAEAARLREDAARYQWLAANVEELPYPYQWEGKEWLDARIDAAMGSANGQG